MLSFKEYMKIMIVGILPASVAITAIGYILFWWMTSNLTSVCIIAPILDILIVFLFCKYIKWLSNKKIF